MTQTTRLYSLRKSRHILSSANKWYKKKRHQLPPNQLSHFESLLQNLDDAILKGDQIQADGLSRQVDEFCKSHFKKSVWDYLGEMTVAIAIALVVATIVRQSWFELYEIPTGSMRPTFEEQDHLTVSKTAFALNIPLMTDHFYFDPNLVQRLSVITWSGDGIAHLNSDSKFMGIFPYTKRYIKRCMGKPGDTLYFYGGKIYGFDRNGNDLVELRDNPWTKRLDHVPFTNFEGRRSYEDFDSKMTQQAIFHLFNQAIGRLNFSRQGMTGQVFNGNEWVKDRADAQRYPHDTIQTYSDFFGIRNFAMARLLTKEQLEKFTSYQAGELDEGLLYLELRHTPSLSSPDPLLSDRLGVILKGYSTVIPLKEQHLKALMDNMYTCRFIVKNGRGTAYRLGEEKISPTSPAFPKVPDGAYEFYYGKGVKVNWGGITSALPSDHPLYNSSPSNIQKLFNIGIEMTTQVEPQSQNQAFFPNRYVYFRDGALYAMGGVIMDKEDPILQNFNTREEKKEKLSTKEHPYVAFKDHGPPLTADGKLDTAFLSTFGYKIPEGHYLALGDNHAMSQDSRYFGPLPQANLQGAPSLIIWPPGERWGIPNQKPYPLITLPRLFVWGIAGLIALLWLVVHQRNLKRPIYKKLEL